jgi:hypothetical protein
MQSMPKTNVVGAGRASPSLALLRLTAIVVGLPLVLVPAIASFYDGGILDFSVGAIFVAGALGLPLTLVGFSASREGSAAPARPFLFAYRVLTGAMLLTAILFLLRREPEATLLFAFAVIALGGALLTTGGAARDEAPRERGATTVSRDDRSMQE